MSFSFSDSKHGLVGYGWVRCAIDGRMTTASMTGVPQVASCPLDVAERLKHQVSGVSGSYKV